MVKAQYRWQVFHPGESVSAQVALLGFSIAVDELLSLIGAGEAEEAEGAGGARLEIASFEAIALGEWGQAVGASKMPFPSG